MPLFAAVPVALDTSHEARERQADREGGKEGGREGGREGGNDQDMNWMDHAHSFFTSLIST